MSILTCSQVRELAPELALGVLGGAERAEAITHVNECARCQAYVIELTEAADALPLLTAEREPPAGFEDRVLERIRAGRRRARRRWWGSAVAIAAAVAILSVTTVRVLEARQGGVSTPTATSSSAAPVAVAMNGNSGPAGWAYVSNGRAVAVTVDYAVGPGRYDIRLTAPNGTQETLGSMHVSDERGSWTGRSEQTIENGSTIALVDASGHEVCRGTVSA